MMKINHYRMAECLWDKNLKYEILNALFAKPSKKAYVLNDVSNFFWKKFFGSLGILAIYLCEEDMFQSNPLEVRSFVKRNWEMLLERWAQIVDINAITAEMLNKAKRERGETVLIKEKSNG